ncbi:hypothetical protein ACFSMW_06800 [Virgibacillus halophilus]|uniref:Fur-regulated basic protein A n=1 Tax=Tigheibacillus halophilus TaxID=361280 RepID=A0ABU5C6R1_9BACI|nr:hypothetical protein [Virgibacillus halophilus]
MEVRELISRIRKLECSQKNTILWDLLYEADESQLQSVAKDVEIYEQNNSEIEMEIENAHRSNGRR